MSDVIVSEDCRRVSNCRMMIRWRVRVNSTATVHARSVLRSVA